MRQMCLVLLLACGLALAAHTGAAVEGAAFPLRVAESGRHLVDQRGVPVLIQAEAAWSLVVGLTPEEVEVYLRDRRARGFNAVVVNLIEHEFAGAANSHGAPRNCQGNGPFATPRRHAPTIDVDLGQISGRAVRAWWYDPRDGSATDIGEFSREGIRTFTRPDDRDWVLVLDDAAAALPPPGRHGSPAEAKAALGRSSAGAPVRRGGGR